MLHSRDKLADVYSSALLRLDPFLTPPAEIKGNGTDQVTRKLYASDYPGREDSRKVMRERQGEYSGLSPREGRWPKP